MVAFIGGLGQGGRAPVPYNLAKVGLTGTFQMYCGIGRCYLFLFASLYTG